MAQALAMPLAPSLSLICNRQSSTPLTNSISLPVKNHPPNIGGLSIRCARVRGVEIPNKKRVEYSLQYVHGIGRSRARQILNDLNMENKITGELAEEELIIIRDEVSKYMIEGDLASPCACDAHDHFMKKVKKDTVYRLINNCNYSVIINGSTHGFFRATRGLKQGDPFSPALFIIMAEVLTRGLNRMMETGLLKGFTQPIGTDYISHLSFADDILIFCNGGKRTMENLMNFIQQYEHWSGQLLSTSKCNFYVGNKVSNEIIQNIKNITGFKKQKLPIKYLGCPIFAGRAKSCYFDDLINSIRSKIQGWQTNFLNQAGKIILIQHVLQSMPIHIFAAINPPKNVVKEIDKILSNCFWKKKDGKYHWISWKTCCTPKESGGLGIKRLKDIIQVQSLKLYWKLITEDTLWTKFMKTKYNRDLLNGGIKSTASNNWKRIMGVKDEAEQYMDRDSGDIKWKLSMDGQFNSRQTWLKIKGVINETDGIYIWNKALPKRTSVFLWKLIHGRLSVDCNVKKRGIQLASGCHCCRNRMEEDQDHLLYRGEIAQTIWDRIRRYRRFNALAIRRLKEIQCYRGIRHIQGLPCRGQRTKNNCRTLKGKRVAIAGKKKAPR